MWHIHRLCVQFSTFVLPKKYQKLNHKSVQENKSFEIKSQLLLHLSFSTLIETNFSVLHKKHASKQVNKYILSVKGL